MAVGGDANSGQTIQFMVSLSAVIITKNEETNIARCLAALAPVADDVVVIDSGSTDRTVEIAEKMGARVVFRAFDNFMDQKNFGIAQAKFPHVLSVDADEVPDEELQKSILKIKENWLLPGYKLRMLTNYAGTWIYHCGWYPDPKLRLFDTRLGRWAGKNPHEKFEFFDKNSPESPLLEGNLLHFSFPTVETHLRKAHYYSTTGAEFLAAREQPVYWFQLILNPIAKWLKIYVIGRGFLDGKAGWTIARIYAFETFLKYKKALFLRQKLKAKSAAPSD